MWQLPKLTTVLTKTLGTGAALAVMLLGVSVIFGWLLKDTDLTQIHPTFAPMQFNTALGFVMSGVAILFINYRFFFLSRVVVGGIATLSVLTFAQYLTGLDFNIDTIFVDNEITARTTHPGRMSPNTALCFLITALPIFFLQNAKIKRWIQAAAMVLILFVLLSFSGYLVGATNIYGWGIFTRMALHTTVGFALISVALFCFASRIQGTSFNLWDTAPVVSFVVLLTITFFAWQTSIELTQFNSKQKFSTLISRSESVLQERFKLYEQALLGGAGLFQASERVDRNEWKRYVDALNVDENLMGINGIGYIDYVLASDLPIYLEVMRSDGMPNFTNHPKTDYNDKFIIRYSDPKERNRAAIGLDIGFEMNRREAAQRAIHTGKTALTKKIELVQDNRKRAGFLLLMPLYRDHSRPISVEAREQNILGFVYAPFIGDNFLQGLDSYSEGQLTMTVYDGEDISEDKIIYSNQLVDASPNRENITETTRFVFAGNVWTITWQTTPAFNMKQGRLIPIIILVSGLFLTLLTTSIFILLARMNGYMAFVLNKNRDRLKAIVDNAVDGLIILDQNGLIEECNKACEGIFGLRPEKMTGRIISNFVSDLNQHSLQSVKVSFETRGIRHNNTSFPVELSCSKIESNNKVYYSLIVRDITDRKKAEERILQSNEELERFAYICSHDLQEPLRMISNFSEILHEEVEELIVDNEDAKDALRFITKGAHNAQDLIQDVLTYSRLNNKDRKLEDINLNNMIKQVKSIVKSGAEGKQIKFDIDTLPHIRGNQTQFKQLFQNLMSNGVKFCDAEIAKVSIRAKPLREHWQFSVQDNGIGMDPSYTDKVFMIFQRLNGKDDYPGTGIGLAIVKKIVESYGGEIWIETAIGKGATFHFTIGNDYIVDENKNV